MARTDTLANYITDISNAVREKTGKTDLIKANELDTEIASIETGGDISEYFTNEMTVVGTSTVSGISNIIKKVPNNLKLSVTDCSYLFANCVELQEIPTVDTSLVIKMSNMFKNCKKITSIPYLDTSNVTNMASMCSDCVSLESFPALNTSNVTTMSSMFYACDKLTTIPYLDTSNVTNMAWLFYDCDNLVSIPQLNTSKVTTVERMFYYCVSLTTVPLLDFGQVTSVEGMFAFCRSLTDLGGFKDLGKAFKTTQSQNYRYYELALNHCTKLTHDSLMNVINNLYDIKSAGCNNQKLALGSDNLAKLTEEEIAIATNKGWNVS